MIDLTAVQAEYVPIEEKEVAVCAEGQFPHGSFAIRASVDDIRTAIVADKACADAPNCFVQMLPSCKVHL